MRRVLLVLTYDGNLEEQIEALQEVNPAVRRAAPEDVAMFNFETKDGPFVPPTIPRDHVVMLFESDDEEPLYMTDDDWCADLSQAERLTYDEALRAATGNAKLQTEGETVWVGVITDPGRAAAKKQC